MKIRLPLVEPSWEQHERVVPLLSAIRTLRGNRKARLSAELRACHDQMRVAARRLRAAFLAEDWPAWDRWMSEFNGALARTAWEFRAHKERERLAAARERVDKARRKKLESSRNARKQMEKTYRALRAAGESVGDARDMIADRTGVSVNTLRGFLKG